MSTVPGDAASLSSCAVTVRGASRRLAARADVLAVAVDEVGPGWVGRASAATRRRCGDLATAGTACAAELDRVATVLQDHATDLADLVARARAVEERAAAAGLEVRGGRVVRRLGVHGEADAAGEGRLEDVATGLQAELDLVLAQHARRRDFVLGVLRASTATLAGVSHGLRRG